MPIVLKSGSLNLLEPPGLVMELLYLYIYGQIDMRKLIVDFRCAANAPQDVICHVIRV